jgi:ABC-type antimicrobial peptide transport system permease subunit
MVRGISPMAFLVHRQVFITQGHAPGPGEILAGKLAATKLGFAPDALKAGANVYFEGKQWKVSGAFESPGTSFESEIWAPLEDLKIQTKRETLTCAVVRLTSPAAFSELEAFTKTRLDLEIAAVPETKYYGALAAFYRPMQILGWVMACLVIASGLFGGLNTMIAAIAARSKELACLETIGFSRRAIVVALLQESMLQVGTGALIAAGLAILLLAGRAVRVTMGALVLDIGGPVLAAGFAAGLFLAVFGTLIPAMKLARKPIVELLRG